MAAVLRELRSIYPDLPQVMIVGAICRDALHHACGHDFALRRTDDLDIALAVNDWAHYRSLTHRLEPVAGSTSRIRFLVAGMPVDLMPFGENVEQPDGEVTPAPRQDAMSVFGFQDVWKDSTAFDVADAGTVRLPTVTGYTLLKLRAWLDRIEHHNDKDGPDLACAMYWCVDPRSEGTFSSLVRDRLYDTEAGQAHLMACEFDEATAAVRQLATDAIGLLSPGRRAVLRRDWATGPEDAVLAGSLANTQLLGWPRYGDEQLRRFAAAVRQALTEQSS
ncbi:hypothetical protein [Isoptericola croceus]|uniref:hypothetical protein n=1 Tax=Isoptericola croceus TaxID=3031406 RepID=UPI0023F9572F|nr:hypothetical protein [Isoptericola croceus]